MVPRLFHRASKSFRASYCANWSIESAVLDHCLSLTSAFALINSHTHSVFSTVLPRSGEIRIDFTFTREEITGNHWMLPG